MNAAVLHELGQPPRYEQFVDPVAANGEVLVTMRAVGLHPIVKSMASGRHYATTRDLPYVVGIDGVGYLEDGRRVFCGLGRRPFGTMAERTVVSATMCLPVPEGLDDAHAAAIANPGMSAWLSLRSRGRLAAGETVLVLGATGVAGQLAVQFARQLGAGRIIAVGRNAAMLAKTLELGADTAISLEQPEQSLIAAFADEAKAHGIDVVIDYLWGRPTEALLQGISQRGLTHAARPVRLVEVGESAGATITLPAAVLRSSGVEINGSGFGSVSVDEIWAAIPQLFQHAAEGKLRFDVKTFPLAKIDDAWASKGDGARFVITI